LQIGDWRLDGLAIVDWDWRLAIQSPILNRQFQSSIVNPFNLHSALVNRQ